MHNKWVNNACLQCLIEYGEFKFTVHLYIGQSAKYILICYVKHILFSFTILVRTISTFFNVLIYGLQNCIIKF